MPLAVLDGPISYSTVAVVTLSAKVFVIVTVK